MLGLALPAPVHAALRAGPAPVVAEGPFIGLTVEALLTTPYRALRKKTGLKLNIVQRWSLRIAQRRYQKGSAQDPAVPARHPNKLGLIGLLLGAGSFLAILLPYVAILAPLMAIAAIVLGILGMRRDEKPGLAIAALVLGSLNLFLTLVALIVVAAYFGA